MGKWNIKEALGKTYLYASKNAASDVAANNYFGTAAAWVSGGTYAVGDRCTSASIQYYNKTGINTTTAPASDSTNWGFDKSNFQQYITGQTYNIGDKTRYNNLHFVCAVNGTTGTWNSNNWTQVVISNRDVPFKLMNSAINLLNNDTRFVSSEMLDIINNIATHNIYLILSNGIWNEALIAPTKYIRIVGQSNTKTLLASTYVSAGYSYIFYDNCYFLGANLQAGISIKSTRCIYAGFYTTNTTYYYVYFLFCYKNIILGCQPNIGTISHIVNSLIFGNPFYENANTVFSASAVIKNNYFKAATINIGYLPNLLVIPSGNYDYNSYEGIIKVGSVTQTSLAMLQATLPNQNVYSRFDSGITFNSDYTLPPNSVLIGKGSNCNNIGAEGIGFVQTNSASIFDSASGAVYKNITKYGTTLIREQISKTAQSGGANTITLETNASSTDGIYNGFRIYISAGTGAGQTKTISNYVGSSKLATVDSNWTTNPDNTSIYEILDGEVISSVGDLGLVQPIRKMLFNTTNFYDASGNVIIQNVSSDDIKTDLPVNLNYEMRTGLTNDLSALSYIKFKQDAYLEIDNNGYGNGDSNYNPDNVIVDYQVFRYFQIKLKFHK